MAKRYQREVIRICIFKKNRQHNSQKIPKGLSESVYLKRTDNTMTKRYQREVIRICIFKKNRQLTGQKIPKGDYQNLYT